MTMNPTENDALAFRHDERSPFSMRPVWAFALAVPGALVLAGALFAGASVYFEHEDAARRASAASVASAADVEVEPDSAAKPAKFDHSLDGARMAETVDSRGDRLADARTPPAGTTLHDAFTTASVMRDGAVDDDVAVAESEADILELEGAMKEKAAAVAVTLDETPEDTASPAADGTATAEASSSAPSGDMSDAVATQYVNMRAGPADEAEVLAVVPQGAQLSAAAECPNWCEVEYEGRRGWIYKSFIRRGT